MNVLDKFYVIVRSDLPFGLQAAQSVHAARLFAHEHPEVESQWYANSNNLVLLAAEDEAHLGRLVEMFKQRGLRCSSFREPDVRDAMTAIAVEPAARKLVSSLPLAMRQAA